MDEKVNLTMFFNMMIMEEHGAQKKYEMAKAMAVSPELQKIFARFAAEEEVHAQILESELMKLEKKGIVS
ncbi:MAG TPA: ferritin family protein [Anaerolineae bacterium]